MLKSSVLIMAKLRHLELDKARMLDFAEGDINAPRVSKRYVPARNGTPKRIEAYFFFDRLLHARLDEWSDIEKKVVENCADDRLRPRCLECLCQHCHR